MNILICDDDLNFCNLLSKHISGFFSARKLPSPDINIYYSGEAALQNFNKNTDIAFLDVEMPGLSGITLGKELKNINPSLLIFIVTSYSEYLDEAMRFHVFRYLSKPLDTQRLFNNLDDALHIYNTAVNKVFIETADGCKTILSDDIIYIEAIEHSVIVHTISEDYYSKQNMKYWSTNLPAKSFFQTHKSYIINMKYVSSFDHSLVYLHNDEHRAYLTVRKYKQFKDAYLIYLESVR